MIPEDKTITRVQSIEAGSARLIPEQEPQDVYAGVGIYAASNGWSIAVFNDANEWDYLEWVQAPDGRCVHYDDFSVRSMLANY